MALLLPTLDGSGPPPPQPWMVVALLLPTLDGPGPPPHPTLFAPGCLSLRVTVTNEMGTKTTCIVWQGVTGFPWIDAIMRQLVSEGWIHNVARRAVGMFLTRGCLWINWEEGFKVSCSPFVVDRFSVNMQVFYTLTVISNKWFFDEVFVISEISKAKLTAKGNAYRRP